MFTVDIGLIVIGWLIVGSFAYHLQGDEHWGRLFFLCAGIAYTTYLTVIFVQSSRELNNERRFYVKSTVATFASSASMASLVAFQLLIDSNTPSTLGAHQMVPIECRVLILELSSIGVLGSLVIGVLFTSNRLLDIIVNLGRWVAANKRRSLATGVAAATVGFILVLGFALYPALEWSAILFWIYVYFIFMVWILPRIVHELVARRSDRNLTSLN